MKTIKISNFTLFGIIVALLVTLTMTFQVIQARADVTKEQRSTPGQFKTYTFFATSTVQTVFATSTSATSTSITSWVNDKGEIDNGYFVIAGAKEVNLLFKRGDATFGGGNTGTTTFKIQVTQDATNWYDYNQLQRITTTTTGDTYFTRVASTNSGASDTNVGAATSTILYKMDDLGWFGVRCIVVEETDGEHSCQATASY